MHEYYDRLTDDEKNFVDARFNRETFAEAEKVCGFKLRGDDTVEEAVEAYAKWIVESGKASGAVRVPTVRENIVEWKNPANPPEPELRWITVI